MKESIFKKGIKKISRDGLILTLKQTSSLIMKKKEKMRPLKKYPYTTKRGIEVSHVSAFNFGNMGDTYLPVVLKNLINDSFPIKKWNDIRVEEDVTKKVISQINNSEMCLIGGGGLFLRDTHANDVSGWQWNCSIPMLDQITTPIVMFAVGYNRFRGQEDFKPIFTKHINEFVKKASFVGLRNHGSIENIKKYLINDELKDKIVFQPCMTTLTSKIYPTLVDYTIKDNVIGLNCAFDRSEKRKIDNSVLESIAEVVKKLSGRASIIVIGHMEPDFKICPLLDKKGVKYEKVLFHDIEQMLKVYAHCRLVIGMRGHAQMIPFGCKTPILSIISHDKMKWFLDDIHHPEWGCDVLDADFESNLLERAMYIYENYQNCIDLIEKEKMILWDITQSNLNIIKGIIK